MGPLTIEVQRQSSHHLGSHEVVSEGPILGRYCHQWMVMVNDHCFFSIYYAPVTNVEPPILSIQLNSRGLLLAIFNAENEIRIPTSTLATIERYVAVALIAVLYAVHQAYSGFAMYQHVHF
ncbi:hypothetical protein B0H11DRAFT_2233828 [Mycena galericulata]|nr:hypothetical protein B0H11DRAFT_2233828 [Mycena galericulata]